MIQDVIRRGRLALLTLSLVACSSTEDRTQGDSSRGDEKDFEFELVEGEPMYTVLPPDAIESIDRPVRVSAAEAAAFMKDDEPVLGVVGASGTAVCYSAWQLDGHEIVNDVVDGEPIAATW